MMKKNVSVKNQARKECTSIVALNLQTSSLKRNSITTKIIALILTAALVLSGVTPSFAAKDKDEIVPSADISWEDAPKLSGTSAILMDAGSGDILYEKVNSFDNCFDVAFFVKRECRNGN